MSVSDARGVVPRPRAGAAPRRSATSAGRERDREGDRRGAERRPGHADWARIRVMVCSSQLPASW